MRPTTDVIRAQLRDAEAVLQHLDNKLEGICFDPAMPTSVDAATRQTATLIDTLLIGFAGNPILGPLAEQLKVQYLENIRERVRVSQALQPTTRSRHTVTSMLRKVWRSLS